MDYIDIFWVYLQVISAIVAKGVMISYLFVGTIATLYAVGFFFVTGITIFDEGKKREMPFRFKISYVLVMLSLLPYFYMAFAKEIINLRLNRKLSALSLAMG